MFKKDIKILIRFLLLVFTTIVVSISGNDILGNILYPILLYAYYKSKNEPFWLVFFMTTTDGFMGFLGLYSTILNIIPGLPGIELAQIYILIALLKIRKSKIKTAPFYKNWTTVLFIYTLLLVLVGFGNGLKGDLNIYFKIGKMILPLALIYTTPRLIKSIDQYASLFNLLFVVFLFAFAAQLFTVFTGFSPAANYKVVVEDEVEAGKDLRTFYNPVTTVISLFGALIFQSFRQNYFSKTYLNIIVILCFGMAFLSATRGYIIGFAFAIVAYNIFVKKLELKSLFIAAAVFAVIITISLSFEKINTQIMYSLERTLTLESLAKGDKSADGTLLRLEERGPKVMAVWADSPIFGWGFSNTFFEKKDGHVGNQNLLLHSGIVGMALLYMFFIYVCNQALKIKSDNVNPNPYKTAGKVVPVFLLGWFFIHSTSHQQFTYGELPLVVFPQAIFLAVTNFIVSYKP